MKRVVVGLLAVGTLAVAGVALASPAWSAPDLRACALGADNPEWIRDGVIYGNGGRYNCGTSKVTLTVRVHKDLALRPDPAVGRVERADFTNGDLGTEGRCDGNGLYYTWTLSDTGNELESGRVRTC
ncbi:hypothetical protein SAMN05216174_1053 [Actinokineospora iranica]|uniref:Secreted protein n=1 Tax=Actinokineospora iranica TaxID=1271860 RepID=A0A1G6PZB7_9PSEU|nr:hypothetical protein SAMN05216174_1053 [Actinokineospora iranica]